MEIKNQKLVEAIMKNDPVSFKAEVNRTLLAKLATRMNAGYKEAAKNFFKKQDK